MGATVRSLAAPLRLLLILCALAGCAGRPIVSRPPPGPTLLVAGADLHLLAAWTGQVLLYGQAPSLPGERQPWPALYRVPARGGAPTLLGRDVYRLLIRRDRRGEPPPIIAYLTPDTAGAQGMRSTGRLWIGRPGGAPAEARVADPPLVLQPALLSPDNRYLISYGHHEDPIFFAIDLTDLQTGASRRIAQALSTSVPRWLGFDGPPGGARYLLLPNLDGLRPWALLRLDGPEAAPLVLPGRAAALLPDGRLLLEGRDLQAVEARPGGAAEVLAQGPVRDRSTFYFAGAAYFIRSVPGELGPLLRVRPGAAPAELVPDAGELWFTDPAGRAAYVASGGARNLRAVALPEGPSFELTADTVAGYRPLPDGGALAFHAAGLRYWAPGRAAVTLLSARGRSAWPAGPGRFAVIEAEAGEARGALRLLDAEGRPARGDQPVDGVDLADVPDGPGPSLLYYSVPQGPLAGLYSRSLP